MNDFQVVPIERVVESPLNPRRHYKRLEEMAASIRQVGILSPLIVRSTSTGTFELAAGHRRRRAAVLAGLDVVPVIIRPMDDATFLEVLNIDNLQREDIHPLEESEGFAQLLTLPDYTIGTLAERVGKSESYVSKRLALRNLIPELREAFFAERINISHAILLARLLPNEQQELADEKSNSGIWSREYNHHTQKWVMSARPPASLAEIIDTEIYLNLSAGKWKKDDAALVPAAGACTACSKRTKANLALFDDIEKGDRCLDRECFGLKQQAHLVQIEAKLAAKGETLPRVVIGYHVPDGVDAKAVNSYDVKDNKHGRDGVTQKALVVAGPRIGEVVEVYVKGAAAAKVDPAAARKERKEKLERRIVWKARVLAWQRAVESSEHLDERSFLQLLVERFARGVINGDFLAAYGLEGDGDKAQIIIDYVRQQKTSAEEMRDILLGMALHDMLGEFYYGRHDDEDEELPMKREKDDPICGTDRKILDRIGVDWKACVEQVGKPLREQFAQAEQRRKAKETFESAAKSTTESAAKKPAKKAAKKAAKKKGKK
jgi:ParB/RepB/Spo0J family partition protein